MTLGWEAIKAEVLRRIRSRDWPPGALIPNEEVLAGEFGVARATVNRALRELAAQGLIERRRKAGTRVALTPVRRATLEIPILRHEVEAAGSAYSYRLLCQESRELPKDIAALMGFQPKATGLWVEALHLADDQPFAHETRWLNPGAIAVPLPRFDAVSANEWLVMSVSYLSGDIAFSAEPASADEAEVMGFKAKSALFITERMTWTEDQAITWVRLAHAPGYRLRTLI